MRDFFFRQRLRARPSSFAVPLADRFFGLLLETYRAHMTGLGLVPAIAIENLALSSREPEAQDIVLRALADRKGDIVVGLGPAEAMGHWPAGPWVHFFESEFHLDHRDSGPQAMPELPEDLWELGYLCFLLGRIFPPNLIPGLLREMGKSANVGARAVSLLYALGVFDTPLDTRPWNLGFREAAEEALGGKKDVLRDLVRERLLAWVAARKIVPCIGLLERLGELSGNKEIEESLILAALHFELSCSDGSEIRDFLDSPDAERIVGQTRLAVLRHVALNLLAVHFDRDGGVYAAFDLGIPDCADFPLLKTQAHLNRALYHLGWHDGEFAKREIKNATMLCQKSGNSWLARCHRLFALGSISAKQVGETNEYLGFALENAAKSGDSQELGMACFYTASVRLLHGNLSGAMAMAEKALGHFLRSGSPEWVDRCRFLQGRLTFEYGGYVEAGKIFQGIALSPNGGRSPEKTALLAAWAYRSAVYLDAGTANPPLQRTPDLDIFELEALFFRDDHAGASGLLAKLADAIPDDTEIFYRTEQADWRSGFSQCELLCFSWYEIRNRLFSTYRALIRSLSPDEGKIAQNAIRHILRNNRFAEIDPGDVFFHYALCRILKQTGASQIDMRTAASVAQKRLQVRSDRIDSPEIRRKYLEAHWNRRLQDTAREFMLL
ncbi:MAG: hypothetical protein FWD94_08915, partial [Treponema sp.]|nr:hypothetical protein [Treponema sp.]